MSLAPALALSPKAFFTLLLLAFTFGANHIAARVAFNHGVDVTTAVAVRSLATAAVVALIVRALSLRVLMSSRDKRVLLGVGLVIALQSLALYSAVSRLPVALALRWPRAHGGDDGRGGPDRRRGHAAAGRRALARRGSRLVGLALLTLLYGTGFTVMFTLLPKLGVVGNSPILNVEPVAALVMAWAPLGQVIAPVQVAGALLVVGAVVALGAAGMRR